jgi:hypothetical protein
MIVRYASAGAPLTFTSVAADLAGQRTGEPYGTWYQCPSSMGQVRNLFMLRADREVTLGSDTGMAQTPTWVDAATVLLGIETYWWAERDVDIEFLHPYAHPGPLHGPGFVLPTRVSIPEWFRHAKPVYQFYPGHGPALTVHPGDPLCYVRVNIDEPVTLEPMTFTDELRALAAERIAIMHAERPLPARYIDWDAQGFPHDHATWRVRLDAAITAAVGR